MEVTTAIKSEVGPGSRRSLSTAVESEANNNNSSVAKCVKRRRRCPSLLALGSNNNDNEDGLQLQLPRASPTQVDRSAVATTTPTTVKRSSRFRGVSKHRWTGRYEAHLWDKGSWNVTQRKKGKQEVYLGAYDEEESAARAYDLAAIKYWGTSTFTNFPVADYEKEVEIMENVTKEEYLASLRRRSSGFSRGVSKYRGVARHHHNGRWEARIGRVFGNKYLYLGTYSTQEEAAHAYDIAAIEYRGINAVTNFDLSTYIRWLRSGANGPATDQPKLLPTSNQVNFTANPNLHFSPNPFMTGTNFGITIPDQKQEAENILIQQKLHNINSPNSSMSLSSSSSSSPTALGLLLRSSMFKELVEKNSNGSYNTDEGNNERKKYKSQVVEEEDFGGMFNFINGPSNNVPYVCPNSSAVDASPELESKEDNAILPLFNRARQSLWNGSLNLPSI